VYYLLNKPKGYLSTVKDTHNRKTVMDLVPKERGLFPVGRLDKDTSGLMLITNDGELAHRLMHPRYESDKVYQVQTNRALSDNDISRLKKGVDIGDRHLSVCEVLKVIKKIDKTEILLRLHEGRKRQIRRTFEAMGTVVDNLKRIRYCGLDIGNMKEGAFRILTDDELNYIRRKVGLR
jgi:23S rRNA pseudouridine2605 synthase